MTLSLLLDVLIAATPLLLASLGGIINERAGVLNLGMEGMMLVGAVSGFATLSVTGDGVLAVAAAALAGALLALVHAGLTVWLGANQVACGLALALAGQGIAAMIGKPFVGQSVERLPALPMILLALAASGGLAWAIRHTRPGMVVRAVGDNHDSAHALGLAVRRVRSLAVAAGGAMAGMGGAFLSLIHVPAWSEDLTAGRGWIALALVVFAGWNPLLAVVGSLLFGGVALLELHVQSWGGIAVPSQLLSSLPYLVTILVLAVLSGGRLGRFLQPPAMLGKPFRPAG